MSVSEKKQLIMAYVDTLDEEALDTLYAMLLAPNLPVPRWEDLPTQVQTGLEQALTSVRNGNLYAHTDVMAQVYSRFPDAARD